MLLSRLREMCLRFRRDRLEQCYGLAHRRSGDGGGESEEYGEFGPSRESEGLKKRWMGGESFFSLFSDVVEIGFSRFPGNAG